MKKFQIQQDETLELINEDTGARNAFHVVKNLADVGAENRAQAQFILNLTFPNDESVRLWEVVEEIDASDLGGFLGELTNRIDIKKLN